MKGFIFCLLVGFSGVNFAASVQISSDLADAQACATAAKRASKKLSVSKHNIVRCSAALLDLSLTLHDKAGTLVNRAAVFMQLEDFDAAQNDLLKAQDIYPAIGALYLNLGDILYRNQSYPEAADNYSLAIEEGVFELHLAYLNRGLSYKALGETRAALKDFRKALELSPQWALPKKHINEILSVKD